MGLLDEARALADKNKAEAAAKSSTGQEAAEAAKAAAAASGGAPTSPTPPQGDAKEAEVVGKIPYASAEDREFVVGFIEGAKETLVNGVAELGDMNPDDADIAEVKKLRPLTKGALEVNATIIAPKLRELLKGGWWVVGGALLLEGIFALKAMNNCYLKRHPEERARQEAAKKAATEARSARREPAPTEPAEPEKKAAAPPPGFEVKRAG